MYAIEQLTDVPLFAHLKPEERQWVYNHIHRRRFRPDTTIIHRGAPGTALYILLSGRVKVQVDSVDGRNTIVAFLRPGDLFGELAVLDGGECSADVSTLDPIEVVVMMRSDLLACFREVPQVAINLLNVLAARLRRTTEMLQVRTTLDAQGLVAWQLLVQAELNGTQSPMGMQIDLGVPQRELADCIGVARETVSRILATFRRRGWIATDKGKRITLLREDQLARRCGVHTDS